MTIKVSGKLLVSYYDILTNIAINVFLFRSGNPKRGKIIMLVNVLDPKELLYAIMLDPYINLLNELGQDFLDIKLKQMFPLK